MLFCTPYVTLIGQKDVYFAIKEVLEANDLPAAHLVKLYNPEDKLHKIFGGWLRDCQITSLNGIPTYTPALEPDRWKYYPCTMPPLRAGRGSNRTNIRATTSFNDSIGQPCVTAQYTAIEGGNCIKLSLTPQKIIAIVGINSLWMSHQIAIENHFPFTRRGEITCPMDYETLQIVKQKTKSTLIPSSFNPETDYPSYIDLATTYAQEQTEVVQIMKQDLSVDEICFIEQPEFHIDFHYFALKDVLFMHSTSKTLNLLRDFLTDPICTEYYNNALAVSDKLIPLEARNKRYLEAQGIEVVELCGVLQKEPSQTGLAASLMNIAILSGNILVNCGVPKKYIFLKTAFIEGIQARFPGQSILFTQNEKLFKSIARLNGGFRCASIEMPPQPEWKIVLATASQKLKSLYPQRPTLKNLLLIFHDINITWHQDLRKTILTTYNRKTISFKLPVDWETALAHQKLDTLYSIDYELLYMAFKNISDTLTAPL